MNAGFLSIFLIQIHLRLITHGPHVFLLRKFWSCFEYFAILIPSIIFLLEEFSVIPENRVLNGLAKSVQILKVLPILRKIPIMKKLLSILYYILPQAVTISMLLIIILIIYSLIGVEFFAYLKTYNVVGNEDVNFRSVGYAMHTLLRGATGEGWPLFMSKNTI